MGTISVTLPTDGTTGEAADVNTPITTIVNLVNGNIDNDNISASAAIAASKLGTGTAGVANAQLNTTAGDIGGARVLFTPSWTNLTVGAGGTNTGYYTIVGKTCSFETYFKFGTGSAVGSTPILTLPATISSHYTSNLNAIGTTTCVDANTGNVFYGRVDGFGACRIYKVDGTYCLQESVTALIPMTWATDDLLLLTGSFEIA